MRLVVRDLGRRKYADALAVQESVLAARLAGGAEDHLLFVEHEPVFTLGRAAHTDDLLDAPHRLGVEVFRTGRGGGVTYHGPGQMVAYPIISLPPQRRDVRRYVGALQSVLRSVCADCGVEADVDEGPHPGVWVAGRKIAAIGVALRRWVTWHGVALNVTTDLDPFAAIVPCGIRGMRATSLARESHQEVSIGMAQRSFQAHFAKAFGFDEIEDSYNGEVREGCA